MVIRANAQSIPTLLVLRKQFLETRPRPTPLTDQELQTMPHQQCVAVLHMAGGYALFHLGEWEHQPVLWVDELFLQPAARKQGHFKEFVDWIRGYCEYNGIGAVMGMAFSFEEGLPLKTHTTAKPVAQILQVPVSELYYRPAEQSHAPQEYHTQSDSVIEQESVIKPKRGRKKKQIIVPPAIGQVHQGIRPERAVEYQQNGEILQHRSGVAMPLPTSPERM